MAEHTWALTAAGALAHLLVVATAAWLSFVLLACQVHLPIHPARLPCAAIHWPHPAVPWVAAAVTAVAAVALIVAAARSLTAQVAGTRRLVRRLSRRAAPPGGRLGRAVDDLDLRAAIVEVGHPEPVAFCHGLVRPRIIVSSALVDLLDDDQLRAVIAHEAHHAARRDPLRLATLRLLARIAALFPALRDLADHHAVRLELAADHHAIDRVGRLPTIAALHAILTCPRLTFTVDHLPRIDALEARVDHLTDNHDPRLNLQRARIALTATSTVLLAAILLLLAAATLGAATAPEIPVVPRP